MPCGRFVALALLAPVACGCSDSLDLGHDVRHAGDPETTGGATCARAPCFTGPVLDLGASRGSAKGLALDETDAYWAASFAGAIMKTPKAGGPSTEIPTDGPYLLSSDAEHVYFTSQVGGYVASLAKSDQGISFLASDQADPSVVLAADDGVYFMTQTTGEVRRVALDGSILETLATGLSLGGGLALDADFLYFVDTGRGDLWAQGRGSGENQLLAGGRAHPGSPIARGEELYFLELGTPEADYADGAVLRMPRAGGDPVVLVAGLDAPTGLAADADALYVCTRGNGANGFQGRVVRLSDSGELRTLAVDQPEAHSIAVDATGVYWTVDAADGLRALKR
jgi:hypothetical protein